MIVTFFSYYNDINTYCDLILDTVTVNEIC